MDLSLNLINFPVDYLGWGDNFRDHSPLFRPTDVETMTCRAHLYGKIIERQVELLSNSLQNVAKRVELLGHTIDAARTEYTTLLVSLGINHADLSFESFHEYLATVNVISDPAVAPEKRYCELFCEMVNQRNTVLHSYGLMERFHPWSTLRLLADNPTNLELPVTWDFGDAVAEGWVDRDKIVRDLSPDLRFLIVTEGSSDAKILAHALRMLRPEIADFFSFVDMQEGYPFSGTGNLHRFCQGLMSIGILNRVLIIYDNDAEESARYVSTRRLRMPPNMRVMKLPDLPAFECFETIGPSGVSMDDINGRAAAIECYLDLSWCGTKGEAYGDVSGRNCGWYAGGTGPV